MTPFYFIAKGFHISALRDQGTKWNRVYDQRLSNVYWSKSLLNCCKMNPVTLFRDTLMTIKLPQSSKSCKHPEFWKSVTRKFYTCETFWHYLYFNLLLLPYNSALRGGILASKIWSIMLLLLEMIGNSNPLLHYLLTFTTLTFKTVSCLNLWSALSRRLVLISLV